MTNSIVSLISSVASLVAMIFGDKLLRKWVTAFHLWYRRKTKAEFQRQVDAEYERLSMEWDELHANDK